ncbi:hypothetical protein F53441_13855 [Fusarium austroafricanum]|uniref:Uncharacterized protein n=1 Tax=Fusarium austroafricanum TaxID=2364996 RepID=A0A8H4JJH4_9HYPO|nr:hypothetical protein F53441_13855 [Fusarium austroafricanum]
MMRLQDMLNPEPEASTTMRVQDMLNPIPDFGRMRVGNILNPISDPEEPSATESRTGESPINTPSLESHGDTDTTLRNLQQYKKSLKRDYSRRKEVGGMLGETSSTLWQPQGKYIARIAQRSKQQVMRNDVKNGRNSVTVHNVHGKQWKAKYDVRTV